jgi:hypothetical protein
VTLKNLKLATVTAINHVEYRLHTIERVEEPSRCAARASSDISPEIGTGYKFDLRLYVLVTNMHPLEAFIYKKGFGRLSSEVYSTDPKDMTNRYVHLTNSSINRHNVNK